MKNQLHKITICLIVLFTIISCATNKPYIIIDKKMEALQLAYNFAIQDSVEQKNKPCETDYYIELSQKNESLKNHKLVKFIQNGDYWGGDLPMISLCFDENLNIKKNIDYDELKLDYKYHYNKLDTLQVYFKDFYNKVNLSNTNKFNFEEFNNMYKKNEIETKLKSFFRSKKQYKLKIFFNPIDNIMSKAITFIDDGAFQRSMVLGYINCKINQANTNKIELNFDETNRRIITHENCHLYTNTLFKKYFDKEFKEKLKQDKFKDYNTNIDEIIVRGIAAKILAINYGEVVGAQEIGMQHEASRIVYDTLDEYIKNPKMSFETIYIKIIENLKNKYFSI